MNEPYIIHCMLWICFFLQTQSAKETPSCDTICITNSIRTDTDAAYHFLYFNTTLNGSVYFDNRRTYLHPYIKSDEEYQYVIQSAADIGTNTGYSWCSILNPPSGYIFDPYDCFNGWRTYDEDNDDPDQQIIKDDPNQRLVNCNNLVVSGNEDSTLDGTYEWLQFNLT
eukprot:222646_1